MINLIPFHPGKISVIIKSLGMLDLISELEAVYGMRSRNREVHSEEMTYGTYVDY